jgi:hypothetical protein
MGKNYPQKLEGAKACQWANGHPSKDMTFAAKKY